RWAALQCLDRLGPLKAQDLPVLLRSLAKCNSGYQTAQLVAYLGRGGVRQLIGLLGSPQANSRAQAADALGLLGPRAAPAVPSLIRLTRDPDPLVRRNAAGALARIGKTS
ncbi:MAG TPA: HEAT repeat domain-containing protein, partial [Gemmataceae bacterium]|nr:HEAT repeat domain-containing protein [Gemmataceae bacterium]